jgi:hypothetical protein
MSFNVIYRTDFVSDAGKSYRLEMIPSFTSPLSSPAPVDFAPDVFLRECIVSAEFDKLPIGMVSVGLMKLKLNASALTTAERGVIFAGAFQPTDVSSKVIVGGDTPTTLTLTNFAGWVNAGDASNFNVLRTEEALDNGYSVEHILIEVKQTGTPKVYQYNRFSVYEIVDQNGNSQGFQTMTVVQSFTVSTVNTIQQDRNIGNLWRLTRLSDSQIMFEGVQKRNPAVKATLKSDADMVIEIELVHIVRAVLEQVSMQVVLSMVQITRQNSITLGTVKFGDRQNLYALATLTAIQTALASEMQKAYRDISRNATATCTVQGIDQMLALDSGISVVVGVYHETARSVIPADMNGFDFCARLAENFFAKCVPVVSSGSVGIRFLPILDSVGSTATAVSFAEIVGDQEVLIGEDTIRGVAVTLAGQDTMEIQSANYGSKREGDFLVRTIWSDAVTADPPDGVLTAYLQVSSSTNAMSVKIKSSPVQSITANARTWSGALAEMATARRAHAEQTSLAWVLQKAYLQFFGKRKARVQEQEIVARSGYFAHDVGTVCAVSAINDIAQPPTTGVVVSAEHDIVKEIVKTRMYCFDPSSLT